MLQLKVTSEPAVEPVSLSEALTHCRVNSGDDDAWFTRAIKIARRAAENYQWRAYINQTIEVYYDKIPDTPIYLPRSPVSAVNSIKLYDEENAETSLTLTNFLLDYASTPSRITLNDDYDWPSDVYLRDSKSVIINYTAGYGVAASAVPDEVKAAMLIHIAWQYENKAGETPIPEAFFDILRPSKVHYRC